MTRSAGAISWQDDKTLVGPGGTMNGSADGVLIHSEHFHALVETLPVALYMIDAEGRITYYNNAAAKLRAKS